MITKTNIERLAFVIVVAVVFGLLAGESWPGGAFEGFAIAVALLFVGDMFE